MDELIGLLIKKLNEADIYNKINIIIVSDHGIAKLKPENQIWLKDYLNVSSIDSDKTVLSIVSNIYAVSGQVIHIQLKYSDKVFFIYFY